MDMSYKLLYNLRGDDILKYLSLLSTIDKNSNFCYRLNYAQTKAYSMWRCGKFDIGIINEILKNGIPYLEDPQEVLFIETVNTPYGSYRVFPTNFLTHKYQLSQLLCIAKLYNVKKTEQITPNDFFKEVVNILNKTDGLTEQQRKHILNTLEFICNDEE